MKDVTDLILNGNLMVVGRLVDASNATLLANVEGSDPLIEVIYKPVAGERPLWDFPDGNLANREYSAYLLSDLAEFNIVPYTVLREGPFGFGMVQEWIKVDQNIDVVEFGQSSDHQLRKLALFDAIINNTDLFEDRFPENSDNIFDKIKEGIIASVDLEKLNKMIPSLYYPNCDYRIITKQDLLDFKI